MANEIFANTGTETTRNWGVQLGPIMQGQEGTEIQFVVYALNGDAVDLTHRTVSGTITNNETDETATIQGAIVLGDAVNEFVWTTHADDVGTPGSYKLVFSAGIDLIMLPVHLPILTTPTATTTFDPVDLVGVTVAERAWLTAALAQLPDGNDLAYIPNPEGATDGHVWTADGADGADWEAPANQLGDWTVTDETFSLDATGTDPTTLNTLVVAPYSGGMTWRENYTRAANATLPTDNTIKNWGWNVGGGGGRYDTDEVATYLQLERYFELTTGYSWSEWHLNFYNSNDGHRPFQWNIRHSDAYTTASYNIDSMVWMDRAGLVTYAAMTTPASGNGALNIDDMAVQIDADSLTALNVRNGGTVTLNADTTGNIVNIGGGTYAGTFNVLGTSQYFYLPTATSGTPIGVYAAVTANHASASSAKVTGLGMVALNNSASNLAELVGASIIARNDAAGTVADILGLEIEAGTLTSRIATSVTVLKVQPYLAGSSSFSTGVYVSIPTGGASTVFSYGVRVDNQGKAGMNSAYGLKIEDQTGAGSNFALYTGAGLVWLGDNVYMADGKNFVLSGTTGTKLASLTNEKLGFWGATPVVQQVLATGGGASVDDVIGLLQTIGLCKQS